MKQNNKIFLGITVLILATSCKKNDLLIKTNKNNNLEKNDLNKSLTTKRPGMMSYSNIN